MPASQPRTTPRRPYHPTAEAEGLLALLSPERLVAAIGVFALVVFLLASIAGVARAQARKGSDFQFAQSPAPTQAATVYSSRGGASVAELGPVAALSN